MFLPEVLEANKNISFLSISIQLLTVDVHQGSMLLHIKLTVLNTIRLHSAGSSAMKLGGLQR